MPSDSVPKLWPGQTAVLAATGPSFTEEVAKIIFKYRDKIKLFGCNDSFKLLPDLDVFYACDGAWWNVHGNAVLNSVQPNCHLWTQEEAAAKQFKINWIRGAWKDGFSCSSDLIHYGHNSGYQQLNLAYLYGIEKFILVGYNMQKVNDLSHFFGDHPKGLNRHSSYNLFLNAFKTIPDEFNTKIINCTPNSALTRFPMDDLERVLYNL